MKIPAARNDNIVVQNFEKEVLVYDLITNKAYCLNETCSLVWQFCDGENSVLEISRLMSKKLKTVVSEDLVWLALNELKKDGLLKNEEELNHYLAGVSRREMVRKAGLASMVALPIVSSLIAPFATQSQSVFNCLSARDCDDGLLCTIDSCDATGRCIHAPISCTSPNQCDPTDGNCKQCLSAADCSPPNLCTIASCSAGTCVNTPKSCPLGQDCDPSDGICKSV